MAGNQNKGTMRRGLTQKEIKTLPTIRSMDSSKERIRKRKEELKEGRAKLREYQIEMLSAPIAAAKSVPRLKSAVSLFFEEHVDDPYVTPNELALAIGYSSYDALERELHSRDCEPRYKVILEAAVGQLESLRERRMLMLSEMMGDLRGYDVALQRMDRVRAQRDPDLIAQNSKSSSQVAIGIQITENEAVKGIISDRIAALMDKVNTAIPPVPIPQPKPEEAPVEADFEEADDEAAI